MHKNYILVYLEQKRIRPITNRPYKCTKFTCFLAIIFVPIWILWISHGQSNLQFETFRFETFSGLLNQHWDQCIQLDRVIVQTQICAWVMFYWLWKKPIISPNWDKQRVIQIRVCIRFPILLSICFMISSITASPVSRLTDITRSPNSSDGSIQAATSATRLSTSLIPDRSHGINNTSKNPTTGAKDTGNYGPKLLSNRPTGTKVGGSTITVSLPESYHHHHSDLGNYSVYNSGHFDSNHNVPIIRNYPTSVLAHNSRYSFSNNPTPTSTEDLHFRSGSHLATLVLRDNSRPGMDVYRTHVWFRRMKNYSRPDPVQAHRWTRVDIKNCHNSLDPPDLLTSDQVRAFEQSLYRTQIYRKRSLRGQRYGIYPNLPRLSYMPPSTSTPTSLSSSISSSSIKSRRTIREKRAMIRKPRHPPDHRVMSLHDSTSSMYSDSNVDSNLLSTVSLRSTTPHTNLNEVNSSSRMPNSTTSQPTYLNESTSSNQTTAVITVHDIAIRPSILVLKQGSINARLRYIIQLHKELKEQYRLILEARINPEYPPLYIGVIQNVCSHWPANIPRSKCSTKKPRFYQKDTICFCHMPPGIYRQRLRVNLNHVLDGLELPRFLVNILFQGKKLNIYITVKLESDNKNIVGCAEMKLPLEFISA